MRARGAQGRSINMRSPKAPTSKWRNESKAMALLSRAGPVCVGRMSGGEKTKRQEEEEKGDKRRGREGSTEQVRSKSN